MRNTVEQKILILKIEKIMKNGLKKEDLRKKHLNDIIYINIQNG